MSGETDVLDRSTEIGANPAMPARVTTANAAAYVQGIFDRELGLTLRGVEVGSSRDDAMRELTNTTATLYADRVLRELIQNAYDGTLGATAPKILLRLDEREGDHGTLYVANDEYSVPKLLARSGALLGKKPMKQSVVAALGCLSEISLALGSIVGSQAFLKRSGPAVLQPIAQVVGSKKSGVRRTLSKDPEYMTDEQRTILGFAGEFAAYQYLKKVAPAFSDDHWVSSLGRRFLGLPPGSDEDGADFYIPRSRIPLYYEVKAHTGYPGYVDLGPSQVAKAAELANDRHGRWRILYVANVSNPASVTVHELDNPFSTTNQSKYRQAGGQGVRFHMNRE